MQEKLFSYDDKQLQGNLRKTFRTKDVGQERTKSKRGDITGKKRRPANDLVAQVASSDRQVTSGSQDEHVREGACTSREWTDRLAKGQLRDSDHREPGNAELWSSRDQKGGPQSGAQGRPARPWGGLKGRQAGHTDCSTNGRITGIVTPTQPP